MERLEKSKDFDLGLWWDLGKTFIKKIAVDCQVSNNKRGATGCPLSAILYSLLAETLGGEIRNSKKLYGIVLPGNKEIKITQYADDTIIYLSEKTQLKHLFEILKRFEMATGSKGNEGKTKGIRLRKSRHIDECHPKIKWKNEKGIKIWESNSSQMIYKQQIIIGVNMLKTYEFS